MKKILLVTNGLQPGGVEVTVKQLALFLRARGDEVRVCALRRRGLIADELEEAGIPVCCPAITSPLCLGRLAALVRQLREFCPDVVHAHLFAAEVLAWWALRRAGVNARFIISKYETGYWMRWYHYLLEKMVRRRAANVLIDSPVLTAVLAARGYAPAQLALAYPLVEQEVITAGAAPRDTAAAAGAFRLLCLSRFEEVKGHWVLASAVGQLKEKIPELRVSLAGDGAERDKFWRHIKWLGLKKYFSFIGFRRDIAVLLRDHTALVLPSLDETTPLVLLEAMAAGIPIIASRLPGVTAILNDGIEALLVRPGSVLELGQAICRLHGDRPLAASLAAAARQRFLREFQPADQLRKIADCYE